MSISETDIKLLKPEHLSDFDEGGGRMTVLPIVDGVLNNMFDDISGLDRAYGRTSLRKAFAAIQTDSTDIYLGAHVIVTNAPADSDVSVLMFTRVNWLDTRVDAQDYVESYSTLGPKIEWTLMGTHYAGQKIVQLFSVANIASLTAVVSATVPDIGDIICLSIEGAGYTPAQQYVRVTSINSQITQSFYDTAEFFKSVLVLEVSDPLQQEFDGIDPIRTSTTGAPTAVRSTIISDAAHYFSVKQVADSLAPGDVVVQVDTPYARLVPSNTTESPLADVPINAARANYIQAGNAHGFNATVTMSSSAAPDFLDILYMGRGILPGSLVLTIAGVGYKDNAQGGLVLANGNLGAYTGTVDYAAGKIEVSGSLAWSAMVVAQATQAVVTYDNANTLAIDVGINNRTFNWVQTLSPAPTPGTLMVDYRALNRWYRLYDDGNGHLTGRGSAIGTGTINYASGTVLMTLAALPDADTQIIFSWAVPTSYLRQNYASLTPIAEVRITLANTPVVPGSLTISWLQNGVAKAATVGDGGSLSGDASGYFVAATGDLRIRPTVLPVSGTVFTLHYDQSELVSETFTPTADSAGVVNLMLGDTPIKPGSLRIDYHAQQNLNDIQFLDTAYQTVNTSTTSVAMTVRDDADGQVIDDKGTVVGTIDYGTGAVSFTAVKTYSYLKTTGEPFMLGIVHHYVGKTHTESVSQIMSGTAFVCGYSLDSASPTAKTETVALTQITLDLSPQTADELVAGSLYFIYAGDVFIDRNGSLYRRQSRLDDSAQVAGSINYSTGLATLTVWTGGSSTLNILGAVTVMGSPLTTEMFGRTPGAPLAPGHFSINVTAFDGTAMVGVSADNNGVIAADYVQGTVDWTTGVYKLRFGALRVDSDLSPSQKLQSWYDPDNVVDGMIYVPLPVLANTAKFNAVLISYLPLEASILGINTVRLPQDGRVPVFRLGDLAVVHNTQTYTLPNPAVASHTYDMGRTRLSYARLYDKNGLIIPASNYAPDLNAGTVTIAPDPVFTGFVQPFYIEHRVEDMRLVTDVQVSGQVTLDRVLTHIYPAHTSFISTALKIGDMQARVPIGFEQTAWSAVWLNVRSGNAPLAQFNSLLFPIAVTNRGAIMERWVIVFTSPTAFSCYGESYGLVAISTVNDTFAPVNPLTQYPYFTIDPAAWGLGWSTGNCYRFNTVSANYPLWVARCTNQSEPVEFTDRFTLQVRGDSN